LRAYGGSGEYKGYKVGRLLRDFYFSGKGLVDKPANPRSIIFRDSDPFNGSQADINYFTNATEKSMELEQLKAELDSAKSQAETLKTQANDLTSAIAEKDTKISTLEVKVKELEDAIASISQEKSSLSDELNKMVAEAKLMKRKASLKEFAIDDAKAEDLLAKFSTASDEMFESVISLLPKAEAAKNCSCNQKAEDMVEDKEEDEETDCEDSKALEEVEADSKASLKDIDKDANVDKSFASAMNWFEQSVLTTTKSK
jgi:chromosome segregation ATPase